MIVAVDTSRINDKTMAKEDIASEEAIVEGKPASDLHVVVVSHVLFINKAQLPKNSAENINCIKN
jgi:hypothetical protein